MYMVREHDPEFFLNTAHEFVSTLDIIKATGKVPPSHMNKWREFEGKIFYNHVSIILWPANYGDSYAIQKLSAKFQFLSS